MQTLIKFPMGIGRTQIIIFGYYLSSNFQLDKVVFKRPLNNVCKGETYPNNEILLGLRAKPTNTPQKREFGCLGSETPNFKILETFPYIEN